MTRIASTPARFCNAWQTSRRLSRLGVSFTALSAFQRQAGKLATVELPAIVAAVTHRFPGCRTELLSPFRKGRQRLRRCNQNEHLKAGRIECKHSSVIREKPYLSDRLRSHRECLLRTVPFPVGMAKLLRPIRVQRDQVAIGRRADRHTRAHCR